MLLLCSPRLLAVAMQTVMSHATLKPVLDPLLALRAVMRGKALMRLKYEGKDKAPDLSNPDSKWHLSRIHIYEPTRPY